MLLSIHSRSLLNHADFISESEPNSASPEKSDPFSGRKGMPQPIISRKASTLVLNGARATIVYSCSRYIFGSLMLSK